MCYSQPYTAVRESDVGRRVGVVGGGGGCLGLGGGRKESF